MGYYGEEGTPLTHTEIEAEIEKAWTPSASNFDSERSRHKRTGVYEGGSLAAAGAGGAYAAHHGVKAAQAARGVKVKTMSEVHHRVNSAGKPYKIALGSQGKKAVPLGALKKLGGHSGKAAVGLAAVGGAAATHSAIKRKKASGWQSYAKRDEIEKLTRKEKGALGGAVGGVFGPVGSATASGILAPKGSKVKHTAIGAGAGLLGPLGGAASGYAAAGAKKKKVSKSAFGVDHSDPNGQHRETEN